MATKATERTPLAPATATTATAAGVATTPPKRDEFGYEYVEDDGLEDEGDDQDKRPRRRSAFFRDSDNALGGTTRDSRRTRLAAYALLVLLVLFFVWSSLRPEATKAAVVVAPDSTGFFCGLTNYETGYVKLANKKDDHYFYWLVASASAEPSKDPLVLWLTGGPGVPSTVALLSENGPCLLKSDGVTAKLNPFAWNKQANVIWLDQPTNVGFSYGAPEDADTTEDNVGENIFWFLQGFFDKHPEFVGREFFVTGESYGGHYVPAAAHYVWQQNKLKQHKHINLQGIAIGNGLVDAAIQYPRYIDMVDNAYNITFVNDTELAAMRAVAPECEQQIRSCQTDVSLCAAAQVFCESNLDEPFTATAQRNPFDIRKFCAAGDAQACNAMDHVATFLNHPEVRSKLQVDGTRVGTWKLLSEDVHTTFSQSGDVMVSYSAYVGDLLDAGIRVLVYTGDADLACNWYGNDAWTRALEWREKAVFNAAEERDFVTRSGVRAGTFRTVENRFTFVRVFNAGHMVPQDQPEVALDLISRFLSHSSLS